MNITEINEKRIEEIKVEMSKLQKWLDDNPLNAMANAHWKYLDTVLREYTKFSTL